MDVYILDDLMRRIAIVDVYISFVWAERAAKFGDFELVLHNTRENANLFSSGLKLSILESDAVMVVETNSSEKDEDGNDILKVTGRSLESITDDRIAAAEFEALETRSTWSVTGTPGDIMRYIFKYICIDGLLDPGDIIPYIQDEEINLPGNIPEPDEEVTLELEIDTLANTLMSLAQTYKLGFRLVRKGDDSKLYFEVFMGNDRTSAQAAFAPVIFAESLDTLSNTSSLTSIADYKTMAYVFAKNGSAIVYADNVDSSAAGFDRKVLLVKADNIDLEAGAELDAALQQLGKEELAKHRPVIAFDGEIPQYNPYTYGKDYGLGDLVEVRGSDGKINNMYVTEQIFSSDENGVRAYPTLEFDLLITPDSWYGWDANQQWYEVPDDADHEWADA